MKGLGAEVHLIGWWELEGFLTPPLPLPISLGRVVTKWVDPLGVCCFWICAE